MVGLVLYVLLLAGGAWVIAQVHKRDEALGLALGASLLGLFVHALFYSGFLEDPLTWLVLGTAAGSSPGASRTSRRRRPPSAPGRGWPPRDARRAGAWILVGVLFGLIAITLPELGSDPWRFRPGTVDPQGRSRRSCAPPARSGTWASRAPPASSRRSCAVPRPCCCCARACLAALGGHRARADGRLAARGALDPAPARAARLDRALVLHERLDLPDRAGRRPAAGPRQPLRARLPRSGLERFYTRDGSVSERVREREVALGTSPTSPAPRSAPPPGGCCPSRSTTTGCSCCSARSRCCPPRSRSAGRSAGGSCWARCSCATRSPYARPGSGRTTRPACCCSCSRSRSSRAGGSAGPRQRSPGPCCSSSSRSSRCRSWR